MAEDWRRDVSDEGEREASRGRSVDVRGTSRARTAPQLEPYNRLWLKSLPRFLTGRYAEMLV